MGNARRKYLREFRRHNFFRRARQNSGPGADGKRNSRSLQKHTYLPPSRPGGKNTTRAKREKNFRKNIFFRKLFSMYTKDHLSPIWWFQPCKPDLAENLRGLLVCKESSPLAEALQVGSWQAFH